jgi:hypothetical protein
LAALQEVRHYYDALLAGDLFDRGRRLRNEAITHLVVPATPTPTMDYDAIYQIDDAAEELALKLCAVVGFGRPEFIEQRHPLTVLAHLPWRYGSASCASIERATMSAPTIVDR